MNILGRFNQHSLCSLNLKIWKELHTFIKPQNVPSYIVEEGRLTIIHEIAGTFNIPRPLSNLSLKSAISLLFPEF